MVGKVSKSMLIVIIAMAILVSTPMSVEAGCKITITVKNDKNYTITVNWKTSKVKIKGGIWKKLGTNSQTIGKGKERSHSYNATFGCNKKRQYKIYWSGGGSDGWEYYPSSSGFTKNVKFTVTVN
ncbi:MAG: hypothetical protein GY940_44895 [bacterium]|nr:hypothetical protein [bacterium]